MIEHPERRHWHTVDTDMDESDSDESEKEYPDNTDVNESDSGEKDEDEDHHITIIPRNDAQNPYKLKIRSLTSYYPTYTRRNRPY